jgi:hypothetical protein
MNKNNNACNNCGKQGHSFHQCKLPITSYGVIAFRASNFGIQYLMLRRKDSFGYIDFVRGKYSPYNISQIQDIVDNVLSRKLFSVDNDVDHFDKDDSYEIGRASCRERV